MAGHYEYRYVIVGQLDNLDILGGEESGIKA